MFPVGKHSSHNFMHVFKNGFVSCSSYRIYIYIHTHTYIHTYMEIKLRETTADLNLNMVGRLGKVTNTLKFVGQKTYKKDTLWKIQCYVKIILKWILNKQGKRV